jgi:phage/conjugal plasmid C-4 type zinc finger TraR family protein
MVVLGGTDGSRVIADAIRVAHRHRITGRMHLNTDGVRGARQLRGSEHVGQLLGGGKSILTDPSDELAQMRAARRPAGASRSHCVDCEKPIPGPRRQAIPGVTHCIDCQQERDATFRARPGINHRGSKDSQLK